MRSPARPRPTSAGHPPRRARVGLVLAAVAALVVAATVGGNGPAAVAGAQDLPSFLEQFTTTTAPTTTVDEDAPTTTISPLPVRPGRVAYVTPSGDVVVAESDGSEAQVVGRSAARNRAGLSPLAWSRDGQLAYVRQDRALVVVPIDGDDPPRVVADDAVVPDDAGEDLLSFLVTNTAIAYMAELPNGKVQAGVTFFDGAQEGAYVGLTDPNERTPLAFQFSPLDPYLWLRSADAETGRELTVAAVDVTGGEPLSSPYAIDDPVFAPDGSYVYGVVNRGLDQLVRLDTLTGAFSAIRDQDRICKPEPSPDGRRIVYGAGPNCAEVWVIGANGSEPRMVTDTVGGSASFVDGSFSWSLDGKIVSHAACNALEVGASCGGPYWDIEIDGSGIRSRALAGSVQREFQPLIRPVKADIEVDGPIEFQSRFLLSNDSFGNALRRPESALLDARGVDVDDGSRAIELTVLTGESSRFLTGTVRITDPTEDFDEEFVIMGSLLLQSYRYLSVRGIWLKTSSMPLQSGRIDLTLYR